MIATGKNYYRPEEVAKMLSVSVKTIYLWVDSGRMEAEKFAGTTIRIKRESIEKVKKPAFE